MRPSVNEVECNVFGWVFFTVVAGIAIVGACWLKMINSDRLTLVSRINEVYWTCEWARNELKRYEKRCRGASG